MRANLWNECLGKSVLQVILVAFVELLCITFWGQAELEIFVLLLRRFVGLRHFNVDVRFIVLCLSSTDLSVMLSLDHATGHFLFFVCLVRQFEITGSFL